MTGGGGSRFPSAALLYSRKGAAHGQAWRWRLKLSRCQTRTPSPNLDRAEGVRAIAQQIPILEIGVRNWIARNFEMEDEEVPVK